MRLPGVIHTRGPSKDMALVSSPWGTLAAIQAGSPCISSQQPSQSRNPPHPSSLPRAPIRPPRPALRPAHQPNQSRNTPSSVSAALCPGMSTGLPAESKRPMRGPRIQAAASEAKPPTCGQARVRQGGVQLATPCALCVVCMLGVLHALRMLRWVQGLARA
jgi:hypothetical protein